MQLALATLKNLAVYFFIPVKRIFLSVTKKQPIDGLKTSDVYDAWCLGQIEEVNPDAATLIRTLANRSFDPKQKVWTIEFQSNDMAEAIANRPNIAFALSQKGIKLAVKSARNQSTLAALTAVMNKKQIKLSTGITSDAAKRIVDQSQYFAGVCAFSDLRLKEPVLYINGKAEEFAGVSTIEILTDSAFSLFLASAESTASLNELERKLREEGQVEDFPLISQRTNGDYGEYRVNAWYVPNWSGIECRVTEYLSFKPLPLPAGDRILP